MTKKVESPTWPWPADPFITLTMDEPATSGAVVALVLVGFNPRIETGNSSYCCN